MKKLLLFIAIALISVANVNAQCTPGANFADSTYGVWPDTTQNFPNAVLNAAYSTVLNFKVPLVVTAEMDPSGVGVGSDINNFEVTNVTGLPPGITYACNITGCIYDADANGCAELSGTPTALGVFPITIEVSANINIMVFGFPVPTDVPTSFEGYKIEVIETSAGIFEMIAPNFTLFPNPSSESITLIGLNGLEVSSINIYNTSGAIVTNMENIQSINTEMNIQNLDNGVYFIQINHNDGFETLKFIKE